MPHSPDPTEPYRPYWPAGLCYDWFVLPVVRDGVLIDYWKQGFDEVTIPTSSDGPGSNLNPGVRWDGTYLNASIAGVGALTRCALKLLNKCQ